MIREVGRSKTVIFSTHILPEVEATCDRILIVSKGRIVADGDAATLRRQARARHPAGEAGTCARGCCRSPARRARRGGGARPPKWQRLHELACAMGPPCRGCVPPVPQRRWTLTELTPVETPGGRVRGLTLN